MVKENIVFYGIFDEPDYDAALSRHPTPGSALIDISDLNLCYPRKSVVSFSRF